MSLAVISGGKVKTAQELTLLSTPFFRDFMQGEGTAVAGTWAWSTDANQTNFTSITGQAAGIFTNSSYNNLDEYKWSNIFLTKGTYKITVIYLKHLDRGILEVLFGTASLGTKDCYAIEGAYDQLWEITFTLAIDQTADLRFRANGKRASSTAYYVNFSRFQIEKTG